MVYIAQCIQEITSRLKNATDKPELLFPRRLNNVNIIFIQEINDIISIFKRAKERVNSHILIPIRLKMRQILFLNRYDAI